MTILEHGVSTDIPIDTYHADRSSLSASGAKKLLAPGGPAKFRWDQDHPPESKPHFDLGKVVHKLVLGDGEEIVEVDAKAWTTNAAKAARDEAYAAGKVPLLTADLSKATDMAAAVYRHQGAAELFSEGTAEVSLVTPDPATGIKLRARPDWMTQRDRLTLVDLKTTVDANPDVFDRTAFKFGYYIQMPWYVTVAQLLELDESPAFLFVLIEKEPPYLVSVCELDAEAFTLGRQHMRKAIATFKECSETGVWPGYGDSIHSISLPRWAFTTTTLDDLITID